MSYATRQNMIDRYGAEAVVTSADRHGDGSIDDTALSTALADASSEIDSYLSRRYSVPLASPPESIVHACCVLALYKVSSDPGTTTDEKRQRYEDVISWLEKVAKGDVTPVGLSGEPKMPGLVSGPGRLFGRDTMGGL